MGSTAWKVISVRTALPVSNRSKFIKIDVSSHRTNRPVQFYRRIPKYCMDTPHTVTTRAHTLILGNHTDCTKTSAQVVPCSMLRARTRPAVQWRTRRTPPPTDGRQVVASRTEPPPRFSRRAARIDSDNDSDSPADGRRPHYAAAGAKGTQWRWRRGAAWRGGGGGGPGGARGQPSRAESRTPSRPKLEMSDPVPLASLGLRRAACRMPVGYP
jgi:hypothetical protein